VLNDLPCHNYVERRSIQNLARNRLDRSTVCDEPSPLHLINTGCLQIKSDALPSHSRDLAMQPTNRAHLSSLVVNASDIEDTFAQAQVSKYLAPIQ
jgi:hypothetical protein